MYLPKKIVNKHSKYISLDLEKNFFNLPEDKIDSKIAM